MYATDILHGFNLNLRQGKTSGSYGQFPWLQIETCFREWHLHVTLFSTAFILDLVLWDFVLISPSFSMSSNENQC